MAIDETPRQFLNPACLVIYFLERFNAQSKRIALRTTFHIAAAVLNTLFYHKTMVQPYKCSGSNLHKTKSLIALEINNLTIRLQSFWCLIFILLGYDIRIRAQAKYGRFRLRIKGLMSDLQQIQLNRTRFLNWSPQVS